MDFMVKHGAVSEQSFLREAAASNKSPQPTARFALPQPAWLTLAEKDGMKINVRLVHGKS